jgi:hypothetical protein
MTYARLSSSQLFPRNISRAARVTAAFILATLVCGARAEASIKSERQLIAIISRTPAPKLVNEGQQLKEAEKMAAQIKDATAFLGIGESMEPLYAPNTAVVVAPIDYDSIKKGMTVVYVKSNGRRVAHSVIGETRGGYLVQGVNNDEADAEVVNEKNLIGVIVQAYASIDTGLRSELSRQFAAQGRLPVSAKSRI